jgi:hypothetical protein
MYIRKTVGIDLGLSSSFIAQLDGTDAAIVTGADERGRVAFPTVVGWQPAENRPVAGWAALALADASENVSFAAVLRPGAADARFPLGSEGLTPPEAAAVVLRGLRALLARTLADDRHRLDRAVIAAPASLNPDQSRVVRHAAQSAGFEVAELLPGPIAATVYYARVGGHGDALYLVYDFRGSFFDAAVVRRRRGECEILGTAGDLLTGGDELDRVLAARLAELSAGIPSGTVSPELAVFECLLKERVDRTIDHCHRALSRACEHAGTRLADIDFVVLAGGACRIALVRQAVRDAFCNPEASEHARCAEPLLHDPELCAAYGAALRGAAYGTRYVFPVGSAAVDAGGTGGAAIELHVAGTALVTGRRYRLGGGVRYVVAGGGAGQSPLDGFSVRTRPLASGLSEDVFVDDEGSFAREIELEAEADNAIELTVCDGGGAEAAKVVVVVRHRAQLPPLVSAAPGAAHVSDPQHSAAELDPPWPQFARLVRRCLDVAAEVADHSKREREELFEYVRTQERYAEQAHAALNQGLYRECWDNLDKYAGYLTSLRQEASPGPSPRPDPPPDEEAREAVEQFRTRLAAVWKEVRARGRDELEGHLRDVARRAVGLSARVKTEARQVIRDVGGLVGEIERVERESTRPPRAGGGGFSGLLEGSG